MSIRVLITGVSGFSGRHFVTYAAGLGVQLYGLSRSPLEDKHITGIVGDLCDPQVAIHAVQMAQPDYVLHLAAQTPASSPQLEQRDWLTNNPIGTLNLLEAIRLYQPLSHVLIVSSSAVYGQVTHDWLPIREDTLLQPITMYGISKAIQELLALRYHAAHGLHILRARPFNLLGSGEPRAMLTSTLAAQVAEIAAGRATVVQIRHRATSRDFIDICDAVRAYWAILEQGAPGEVYNVCSGVATPIGEIVDRLLAIAGVSARVQETGAPSAANDIITQAGSYQRLSSISEWRPHIELGESLTTLLKSFQS